MIVEITQLNLVKGTDPQVFLQAVEKTQGFLQKQPGYIDRELLKVADDQWVDLLHWHTAADAKQAAKEMMRDPVCLDFIKMIDPGAVKMVLVEQVRTWK